VYVSLPCESSRELGARGAVRARLSLDHPAHNVVCALSLLRSSCSSIVNPVYALLLSIADSWVHSPLGIGSRAVRQFKRLRFRDPTRTIFRSVVARANPHLPSLDVIIHVNCVYKTDCLVSFRREYISLHFYIIYCFIFNIYLCISIYMFIVLYLLDIHCLLLITIYLALLFLCNTHSYYAYTLILIRVHKKIHI